MAVLSHYEIARFVRIALAAGLICASAGWTLGQTAGSEADRLYAGRADLGSARQAAELWRAELERDPRDFEAAWKLARAAYWIGGHAPERERRAALDRGIEAGRAAATIEPDRPEGHFWMAANMGALAESFGIGAGLKYRKPVREALERVLHLDPGFQQGSADRALGRWFFKVPGLFGGSRKRAEQHLRASLKYNPASTASHYFLAEVLEAEDREAEAREELQRVLDAPLDPEWTPEDQDFKTKARLKLAELEDRLG